MIASRETEHTILGPWSLETSKMFWEGFTPGALIEQADAQEIRAVFLSDTDWTRVEMVVTQHGDTARITVAGLGDLEAATDQVRRFLSLDIDGTAWPEVGSRDPVIADAQAQLPGLRPCGFYSPYEAAAWAVLSQRIQMSQAARLKATIQDTYGDDGAFPAPAVLRNIQIDLPGRKLEYLHAVADAAIDGRLSGASLRSLSSDDALRQVQEITGLGPFAAELVVIRGANFADVLPRNEARLAAEIAERYDIPHAASGKSTADTVMAEIAENWSPFRSWASVHLRALRESRLTGHSLGG